MTGVWIEPHERFEAINAYRERLSPAQIEAIEEAPETALIMLQFNICGDPKNTRLEVVEKG